LRRSGTARSSCSRAASSFHAKDIRRTMPPAKVMAAEQLAGAGPATSARRYRGVLAGSAQLEVVGRKLQHAMGEPMETRDIPIDEIQVSDFNTRKNIRDGQQDSTIADLAASIEQQGLINPVQLMQRPDGTYSLIAGQRRLLAFKELGRPTIPAFVLEDLSPTSATALSLTENFHRADMNPLDKAEGFRQLVETYGSIQAAAKATGASQSTVRRYVRLLNLAPQLQRQLASGEARSTEVLSQLANRVLDPEAQLKAWEQVKGFSPGEQQAMIKQLQSDLSNLPGLRDQALEGAFSTLLIRNCPYDCPTIPDNLKQQVADLIGRH